MRLISTATGLSLQMSRQAAFNRIDSDADGQLTKSEMRKARKEMGKRMKRQGKKGKDNIHRHDTKRALSQTGSGRNFTG